MGAAMIRDTIAAEVMALPEADRLPYVLDLLEFYLDPTPEFFDRLADLGLRLPPQEARILHALYRRRGRFVSLEALLGAAMATRPLEEWIDPRNMRPRVSAIRRAMQRAGLPVVIRSLREVGYRLEVAPGFSFEGPADA